MYDEPEWIAALDRIQSIVERQLALIDRVLDSYMEGDEEDPEDPEEEEEDEEQEGADLTTADAAAEDRRSADSGSAPVIQLPVAAQRTP